MPEAGMIPAEQRPGAGFVTVESGERKKQSEAGTAGRDKRDRRRGVWEVLASS